MYIFMEIDIIQLFLQNSEIYDITQYVNGIINADICQFNDFNLSIRAKRTESCIRIRIFFT